MPSRITPWRIVSLGVPLTRAPAGGYKELTDGPGEVSRDGFQLHPGGRGLPREDSGMAPGNLGGGVRAGRRRPERRPARRRRRRALEAPARVPSPALRGRIRRAPLAQAMGRRRREPGRAGDLPGRSVAPGLADIRRQSTRDRPRRADDHPDGYRGAKAPLPAQDAYRGGNLVPG